MKANTLKQIAMFIISINGLYFTGLNLIKMSGVETLVDALNVMTFFSCFFPFLFLSVALTERMFSSVLKLATN